MNPFQLRVEQVVGAFLETALVVDDEAMRLHMPKVPDARETEPPKEKPRVRGNLMLKEPPAAAVEAVEDHPLDSKSLIDAFADNGIICSVIAPRAKEEIQLRVLKAASRADLLVLDWQLHQDGGTTAMALIKAVLEQDAEVDRRRLRVIAVYTGQPGLLKVMRQIATELKLGDDARLDGGLTLAKDAFRVVGLCKPLETGLRPEIAARQVKEADLPSRLASEFAALTDGLVPAVALAALAAVRNDAHRILHALNQKLDVAYLGHRVASPYPKEAEGHLVAIVASEIASILDDKDVGAKADLPAIKDWLARARASTEDPLKCGSALTNPRSLTDEQIDTMLTDGLGRDERLSQQFAPELSSSMLKKVRSQAAHLFTNTSAVAESAVSLFGMRMAVRTVYSRPHRVLRLGTIVFRGDEFLLCVQPLCDSVRLNVGEIRGYPFLRLTVIDGARYKFVVEHPEGGHLVRLDLDAKPRNLRMIEFTAAEGHCIEAKKKRGKWAFSTANRRFLWVADLKPEFAQGVAVELGGQLARVGLTESELARLSRASAH
jgi:hypothetical protein